jgi:hypothetical protein
MSEQRELMYASSDKKMRHTRPSALGRLRYGMRVDTSEVMPKRGFSHQKVTSKDLARAQDEELKQLHESHSKKAT